MKRSSKASCLEVKYPNCAGIDIAKEEHWVAIRADAQSERTTRSFGCYTEDLERLSAWLHKHGVEQVAMESTGVYWISVYELLERDGFEVWLVDPHQTKRRDGRKSDVLDCQWIQKLMRFGLLRRSHRPPDEICELRSYVRQQDQLKRQRASCVQHLQKALEQMNVRLSSVLSDICGKSGMAIMEAIVDGETDGEVLSKLCDVRVKRCGEEIAAALCGNWRQEHLFALQLALERYRFFSTQIEQVKLRIEQVVEALGREHCRLDADTGELLTVCEKDLQSPAAKRCDRQLQLLLWRVWGVDLTAIPAVGVGTAMTLLSEVGSDFSAFPSAAHFCSWLSLAPNPHVSGGKRLNGRGRRRLQVAGQALRMAAMTLRHSKSYLGARHRARCRKQDSPLAIKASAHQLARIIYAMVTAKTEYQSKQSEEFEIEQKKNRLKYLKRSAKTLGFKLMPEAA